MRAIGIPLLIIGAILCIYEFVSITSGGYGSLGRYGIFYIGGFFMVAVGLMLIVASFVRPVSKYYATEMSPALKITGESIGEGLKESGFGTPQTKEVIKIKCPHCGYLESEDAEFCSKCGKKIQ